MPTLWYCLVAWMLAMYVVFDGLDLGAGFVHRLVAKTPEERRLVTSTIGPVWDGNEVWLLAAGGTLYFAFPALYAASFSGFYLPLMMVLWMLIGRGISLEFYNRVESPVWRAFWDGIFVLSSTLLCLFFGVALGNVVRGVPLSPDGWFFLPLWHNFRLGPPSGILDVYTIVVGLAAVAALGLHGSLWVSLKTRGSVHDRAVDLATWMTAFTLVMTVLVTVASLVVQPQIGFNLRRSPWGWIFPILAVGGLLGVLFYRRRNEARAFLASSVYLVGMLCSAAFGLYPYVLPARPDPALGLTVASAAAPLHGLEIGLAWWIPGMLLAIAYVAFAYRHFAGKVSEAGDGSHY